MGESASGVESDTALKLRGLHDVTREMMESDSRQAVFETATAAAVELLEFPYNTVRMYDPERDVLHPVAASPALVESAGDRPTYDRSESVQWEALTDDEILVYQEVETIQDAVSRDGGGSMIVVPVGDRYVLTLGSPTSQAISESDIELVRVFRANLETAVDRVETVQKLRTRKRRLQQKNERLDRLSGMIAHEFRNPLTIISGQFDFIEGRESDQEHLATARRAVDRMDRLTENLLDLVRNDTLGGATEPIRLDEFAVGVFREVAPSSASIVTLGPITVTANRARLRTVLENLFDNAVDHGTIDAVVWVGTLEDGGFYVADDGPGFQTDDVEDVFSYRHTSGTNGVGLGLAIVRDIASAHGWEITVGESRVGGARIAFHEHADTRPRGASADPQPDGGS
ncbi:GAF domain-containing sensor histidine kinase [Halomicroarcula sp. GCM10025709]|uniref:sensor histidine kinase n=1 Tax=Haloarcula TaxID=2237 RepID=UPI0024C3F39C|nr:GAF domain-containing sensor histidine kinase [Halomicroarcula sp. YJ-61-S]